MTLFINIKIKQIKENDKYINVENIYTFSGRNKIIKMEKVHHRLL